MAQSLTANIGLVVSNILSEKRFSHCRLCLKKIEDTYVRLNDTVSIDPNNKKFQPLVDLLIKLVGEDFSEQIVGVDAVCVDCVNIALMSMRFITQCHKSTKLLNDAFHNINNCFEKESHAYDGDKKIFINLNKSQADLLFMNKPRKRKAVPKSVFECLECLKQCDTFDNFKQHNITVHGMLTCDKCYRIFLTNMELSLHDSQEHKFKCMQCPNYQGSEEGLKKHHELHHKCHVCTECGKSCQGLERLHSHEEKHRTKHTCPKCGKSYTTKDFFDRHVKLCLNNLLDPHPSRSAMDKSFTCEKCDKAYSTQGGLRVHNRFAHGNAKPHVCPECGKKFTAPSYLRVHMIKHTGEKNFKCNICNNRFVSKEALLYHTRRHTGEKPYSCKLCNEKFVNASSRAEHIKFKHIGPTLMCEICSRKFVTSHFLKQHISRHHDPSSKLYYGRSMIPPNLPLEQNMRTFTVQTDNVKFV